MVQFECQLTSGRHLCYLIFPVGLIAERQMTVDISRKHHPLQGFVVTRPYMHVHQ